MFYIRGCVLVLPWTVERSIHVNSKCLIFVFNSILRTPFDKREEYCNNTLKPQLKQLDAYMEGCKFVAGETLTYVDFMFWEILDHMYRFGTAFIISYDSVTYNFHTKVRVTEMKQSNGPLWKLKRRLNVRWVQKPLGFQSKLWGPSKRCSIYQVRSLHGRSMQ